MPEPIPDVNRDHQCYHYQAPGGERCGSPALKGEYYCYHHHIKNANRNNRRVLIDPEVTCMELPLIEDRASIFVALAAVVHRLGQNTIDTRRAGQMIYGLQVALRALEPPRPQRSRISPAADFVSASQPTADASSTTTSTPGTPAAVQPATNDRQLSTSPPPSGEEGCHPGRSAQRGVEGPAPSGGEGCHPERSAQRGVEGPAPSGGEGCHPERSAQRGVEGPAVAPPTHIPISKQSLLYFLRSRHCATCNAELFPASELTERPNPGAPPAIIEETGRPALPAPENTPTQTPDEIPADVSGTLPTLHAGCPVLTPLGRDAATLTPSTTESEHRSTVNGSGRPIHDSLTVMPGWMSRERPPQSTFIARFALHSPRRSVSLRLVHMAPHIPAPSTARSHRILNQKANRRKKWQQ